MTEVESKLLSTEETLLGALNEQAAQCDRPVDPAATSLASTQVLRRRFDDVRRSAEVRHAELEVAVEMTRKFDDKLQDVSGRLDEIAHDVETHSELPRASKVEELQQYVVEQKVTFEQ